MKHYAWLCPCLIEQGGVLDALSEYGPILVVIAWREYERALSFATGKMRDSVLEP